MIVLLTGLVTALGLIAVIGVQNAFVLRAGLLRQHVGVVLAVCIGADVVLEGLGVLGVGALVARAPGLLRVLTWAGAIYLLWCAVQAGRRAWRPQALDPDAAPTISRRSTALTAAALTLLNPHVYLDTMILLGSLANAHGSIGRWWFYAGTVTGSVVWFCALGLGARALAPLARSARAWRMIDTAVAIMMVVVAVALVIG